MGFAGLGGNVRAITNVFQAKYFHPINHKRNTLAFNFVASFATGYDGRELPPFQRLYLGGEQDLRGFDIRTVTPIAFIPVASTQTVNFVDPTRLDGSGNPHSRSVSMPVLNYQISFPGGDTSSGLQRRIPHPDCGSGEHVAVLTISAPWALCGQDQLQLERDRLVESDHAIPRSIPINNRLQIEPGTNFKLRASAGIEFVVHLPIINAPFRLYWSYNYDRLSQQIVAPTGFVQR